MNWQTVDIIPSKGNSNVSNSYEVTDRYANAEVTYYQLVEQDV